MLNSHNHNLDFCNGWDRWWLGWKNPEHTYYISARDINGNEVDADLVYGDSLASNEFILRDFATVGDAIRIKLPHVKSDNPAVRNQYLWIENHQILPHSVESSSTRQRPKGIRFNVQVGNDRLDGDFDKSRSNYLVPLSAFGNYDFMYTPQPESEYYDARTHSHRSNPFTGHHPAMMPAIDYSGDDSIQAKELIVVDRIFKDGRLVLNDLPVYGNSYDAFAAPFKLGIASNPPSTPLVTHSTLERRMGGRIGYTKPSPAPDDNRHVWLNGLRVDILEQYADGSIKVRVVWDDFSVDNDVRWCGSIMLSESLELRPTRTITLDYGLSPTQTCSPVVLDGEKVFASPTVFTCRNGSVFRQETHSTVRAINQSVLVLDSGSVYEVGDGAVLRIEESAGLLVRSGATLRVLGRGRVDVESGAHICIEPGAEVELVDPLSVIALRPGYLFGVPAASAATPNSTCAQPTAHPIAGQGRVVDNYGSERCIQNIIYTDDAYETGAEIRAGYDVCNPPHGDVIVLPGANVILDSEGSVLLERGVEVRQGASLEIR